MVSFRDDLRTSIDDRRLVAKFAIALTKLSQGTTHKDPLTFTRVVAGMVGSLALIVQIYAPPGEWADISDAIAEAIRATVRR